MWITYGPESPYRIFMDFMPGTQARMVSQPRLVLRSGVAGTISMTRAEDIRGQTIQLGTEGRLTAVLYGSEVDLTMQATLTELDSGHPAGYAEHQVANARVRVRLDEHSAVAMAAVGQQKRFVLLVVALPDMPLFMASDRYINVPLEPTYHAAWEGVPERWRTLHPTFLSKRPSSDGMRDQNEGKAPRACAPGQNELRLPDERCAPGLQGAGRLG